MLLKNRDAPVHELKELLFAKSKLRRDPRDVRLTLQSLDFEEIIVILF